MDLSSASLQTVRLGPLPIINHYVARLGIEQLLESLVPTTDKRVYVPYAKVLGVLLRSILIERQAVYRLPEWVRAFGAGNCGLDEDEVEHLGDDRVGRALDRLFDADRGTLLTTLAVEAVSRFGISLEEIHNDTTSVSFSGRYASAVGRNIRGKRGARICHGHSKDHRPDLKQLVFEISAARDGGVPLQFRCADGNTNDALLHVRTWDTLRALAGRPDFLYVADAKLCSRGSMGHIDSNGGRFVTVMPRNRLECRQFRSWILNHESEWVEAISRPNPRKRSGPRDVWQVLRHHRLRSREGWPITWVRSSLLAMAHESSRRQRIATAESKLKELSRKLSGSRCRIRTTKDLKKRARGILNHYHVADYLVLRTSAKNVGRLVQNHPGRPGTNTCYRRLPRMRLSLRWEIDEQAVARDTKMDGVYPLLTNDENLSAQQVLDAHKAQPHIEKRFQQIKTVYDIAPVFLKNEARIEAFFTVFFIAILVQAVIERELRRNMSQRKVQSLPIYPEGRQCKRPTADQIFSLFSYLERHHLHTSGQEVKTFQPQLSQLQLDILSLLHVPVTCYYDSLRPEYCQEIAAEMCGM